MGSRALMVVPLPPPSTCNSGGGDHVIANACQGECASDPYASLPAAKAVLGSVPRHQRWQDGSGDDRHGMARADPPGVLPLGPPERSKAPSVHATVSAVGGARNPPLHCRCAPCASSAGPRWSREEGNAHKQSLRTIQYITINHI
jgi:hypothetical protein